MVTSEGSVPTDSTVEPEVAPLRTQRGILRLAGPIIGENLLENLLEIVDTVLVAGMGTAALASVGAALQVMFIVMAVLSALSIGASVLVAQAFGDGDRRRASVVAKQSLLCGFVVGAVLTAAGVSLSGPLADAFSLPPDASALCSRYLVVMLAALVVVATQFVGGAVLRGVGDTRTPMVLTGAANLLNAVLAYGLIYGKLGLPGMGAMGSAWAALIARLAAMLVLLAILWRGRNGVSIAGRAGWRPTSKEVWPLLRIGVPAGLEQAFMAAAFFVLAVLVAQLGTAGLAAHRLVFTALSIAFLPGAGFGLATMVLVGQSVGARRLGDGAAAARIATWWAAAWMSAVGLTFFLLAPQIIGVFTTAPDVIAQGAPALRAVAVAQPFWAIMFVQAGALRGTGDAKWPLLVSAVGMMITVAASAVVIGLGGQLVAVWGVLAVIAPTMAGLLWWRFRRTLRSTVLA